MNDLAPITELISQLAAYGMSPRAAVTAAKTSMIDELTSWGLWSPEAEIELLMDVDLAALEIYTPEEILNG